MGCVEFNPNGTQNAWCAATPYEPGTPDDPNFTPQPLPLNGDSAGRQAAGRAARQPDGPVLGAVRGFAQGTERFIGNSMHTAMAVSASAASPVLNPLRNAAAGALGQPMPEQLTTDRAQQFGDNASHAATAVVTAPVKWVADGLANAVYLGTSLIDSSLQFGAVRSFVDSGGVVNGGYPAYTPQHALEAPPEWHLPTGSDLLKLTPIHLATHMAESCGRPLAPNDTACDNAWSGLMGSIAGLPRPQTAAQFQKRVVDLKSLKNGFEEHLGAASDAQAMRKLMSVLKETEREIGHASSGLKAAELKEQAQALRAEAQSRLDAMKSKPDRWRESTEETQLTIREVVTAEVRQLQAAHLELGAAKETLASLRRRCDEAISAFDDPLFTGEKMSFAEIAEMSNAIKRGEALLGQAEVRISEDVLHAPSAHTQRVQESVDTSKDHLARAREEYADEPNVNRRRNGLDLIAKQLKDSEAYLRLAHLQDELTSLAQKRSAFELPQGGVRERLSHTEQAELAALDVETARVEAQFRHEMLQQRHSELVDSHQRADFGYRTGSSIAQITRTAVDYAWQNVELAAKWLQEIGKTW